MNIKILQSIIVYLFLVFNSLSAQVTIGSVAAPNNGALLDLKEDNQFGKNSSRGILLPRVKLSENKNLYPMFESDPNYKDNYKQEQDLAHTGLLVYNTNTVETKENRLCPGVHSWNGKTWEPVIPYPDHSNIINSRAIPTAIMTDADGNTYATKFFGTTEVDLENSDIWSCKPTIVPAVKYKGKFWTTANIHTTTAADGTPLTAYMGRGYRSFPGIPADPNDPNTPWAKRDETYFEVDPQTNFDNLESITYNLNDAPVTITATEYKKRFGLSYSYDDAQTICNTADGWRQSTYRDWEDLGALFNDHGRENFRGLSPKIKEAGTIAYGANVKDEQNTIENSYSFGLEQSDPMYAGFNAVPAGSITVEGNNANATYGTSFGQSYEWWLPDLGANKRILLYTNNVATSILPNPGEVGKNVLVLTNHGVSMNREYYMSVRCVKDYVAE